MAQAIPTKTAPAYLPCQDYQCAASDLVQKMESVLADIKSYDDGEPPASASAKQRATLIINAASQWIKIPMGSIVPFDGGIQIAWRFDDRHVRLFCAATESEESYIYKAVTKNERRTESEMIQFDAVLLAQHLRWAQNL